MDKNIVLQSNNLIIPNSYTVEVPLENFTRGARNPFLLNQYLQRNGTSSVMYNGLEVYFSTQQSRTESNRPVITSANAANIAITLKRNGKEIIFLAPYVSYNSLINYGMIRRFVPQGFDLTDSYIQCMDALPDGTTSALLTFFFDPSKTKQMRVEYNTDATGEFSRSKLFPFFIPAAIEVGKPYYFNNAPEIDSETVTGVDAFCYDVLNPNFPATLPIGQINYNTIFVGDVYRVLVVFNDKDGNLILKAPLSSFSRFVTVNNTPTLKPRNYSMKVASGKSYFQFVEPILTPNPVVIPLNFFFK